MGPHLQPAASHRSGRRQRLVPVLVAALGLLAVAPAHGDDGPATGGESAAAAVSADAEGAARAVGGDGGGGLGGDGVVAADGGRGLGRDGVVAGDGFGLGGLVAGDRGGAVGVDSVVAGDGGGALGVDGPVAGDGGGALGVDGPVAGDGGGAFRVDGVVAGDRGLALAAGPAPDTGGGGTVDGGSASQGDSHVEVVASFDAAAGELPEGVAVGRRGRLYVSLGPPFFVGGEYGEVREIDRRGRERTLARFPSGPAPAGLAVAAHGVVYAAVPDPGGPDAGILRITRGGDVERVPGTEAMLVPNGLAIARHGTLYATDSLLGQVWRLRRGDRAATPWLVHELLAGCEEGQLGANGILVRGRAVYVANSDRGLLLRIPIRRSGEPGVPRVLAGDPDCEPTDDLWSLDGIALDRRGRVYATLVLQDRLVRIGRSGVVRTIATADDGLWNPASLTFGTGRDRDALYVTNYAVLPPAPASTPGPALLRVDVGR